MQDMEAGYCLRQPESQTRERAFSGISRFIDVTR